MTKWEEIAKANEAIRTTPIRGKDYAEVNQRVKAFRMVYPNGFIVPRMTHNENGLCIFNVEVGYYTEDGQSILLATGTAYEKENSSQINRTSYIENCETSAVGRALGFAGFGIDTSIASADEMKNALYQQGQTDAPAEPEQPAAARKPKPKPVEQPKPAAAPKPEQKPEPAGEYDILTETAADAELRLKWLDKYGVDKMDRACLGKFGTDFTHTPIDKIKGVMPEE